jgi:hypothetical protein
MACSPSGPGQLTNDFFVNLLDMTTCWKAVDGSDEEEFVATVATGGGERWRASRADLVFGSNSELRAVAEVYAENGQRGEVRRRLRQGLDQGDERRPVRPEVRRSTRSTAFRSRHPCVTAAGTASPSMRFSLTGWN